MNASTCFAQLAVDARNDAFWRALNPDLTISERPLLEASPAPAMDAALQQKTVASLLHEGYFQTPALIPREAVSRLAIAVTDLACRNIPEVFAFVYDEFWRLFVSVSRLVSSVLGPAYRLTPSDIWMFHVPRGAQAAGWGPHRDMGTARTFRSDGTPKALSLWIPLTDATPLNGCMYVLPEKLDPGIVDGQLLPPLSYALLQDVRALPAPAGAVLGWNTRLLHWGGRSSEGAEQPRIAAGMYLHSRELDLNDVELISVRDVAPLTFDASMQLPFETRLRAIGVALRLYGHRYRSDFSRLIEVLSAAKTS
jgi:hypothetical protein